VMKSNLLCLLLAGLFAWCAGCSGGGPDPTKDEPGPKQASEMTPEEIKSERALGARPPE